MLICERCKLERQKLTISYLIHSPKDLATPDKLKAAWTAMETVKASGKARSIGVSNFNIGHLEQILSMGSMPPAVNQVEYSLVKPQVELCTYQQTHQVVMMAYSPLAPAKSEGPAALGDLLARLAKKYYVSVNEICLRWCLDRDVIAVTTSKSESRMGDYVRALTFKMTPRECQDLTQAAAR